MKPNTELRIDWVAPPFAGHLFPMLTLARGLRELGFAQQRFWSAPSMADAVEGAGFEFSALLEGREAEIDSFANPARGIGSNPLALWRQFRRSIELLGELGRELDAGWAGDAPELAIVDSVLPSAGAAARRAGARWWTSAASVPTIETRTGTPPYLGGWRPPRGPLGRLRDAGGRAVQRGFKRAVGRLARSELAAFGFDGVYRADGTEAAYSDECILALGPRELEFERDWPAALEFLGPPLGSPVRAGTAPAVPPDAPAVLVTLGTHLRWARPAALARARAVARLLPGWTVHFSHGDRSGGVGARSGWVDSGFAEFDYVPYGPELARYDAIWCHAGAGVVHAALAAGRPMLVQPHDYDQFDLAARVVTQGAGLRARGSARRFARDLRCLVDQPRFRAAAGSLGQAIEGYDPSARLARLLGSSAELPFRRRARDSRARFRPDSGPAAGASAE